MFGNGAAYWKRRWREMVDSYSHLEKSKRLQQVDFQAERQRHAAHIDSLKAEHANEVAILQSSRELQADCHSGLLVENSRLQLEIERLKREHQVELNQVAERQRREQAERTRYYAIRDHNDPDCEELRGETTNLDRAKKRAMHLDARVVTYTKSTPQDMAFNSGEEIEGS